MTGSDNLTNQTAQRYNIIVSPISTVITTITRKSVKMVAEPSNDTVPSRIPDTATGRLEGNSTVAKAATATAVALDTKARAVQGTVLQLKSELTQSQQSRTEAKVLHAIALKTPSDFGADTAAVRMPGRLMGLQVQDQHVRPDKDQLTTDTADLKMTEEALAKDTAAFEDTTQDCLVCQTKVVDFEVYTNKNLSEELEALAKAKAVISEKSGDAEYWDIRSVLSSHGGLVRELIKSENSIELAQLASRIDSAMHNEISNGDDPLAKVKGLISDMITRSEEKASADDTHNATHSAFEAKHIFNSMHSEIEMMRYMTMSQHKDLYLTISMISFVLCSWLEVMNIPFDLASNTISYRETLNQCKTSFDACSLQPINGAVGEYAGLLVIRKYQESIGQDIGMKSAHGTKPDSAVTSHIDMKMKSCQSLGVSLEKLMSVQEDQAEDR